MPAPIKIVLYNHKGGVGKTTLILNIAAALGEANRKVLLADTDPQCNLTSYFVEDSVVDDWLDKSEQSDGRTVWTGLRPVVEGIGDIRLVKAHETYATNVYLVPGDIKLAEYERNLNDFWRDCLERKTRGYRGITSLSRLVEAVATRHSCDYIFFDTGPNIGPLNRQILLDADYVIIPAACDLFSLRALKTLGTSWIDWVNTWKMISDLAPDDITLLNGAPKLGGYIPQRFRTYGGGLAKPAQFYLSRLEKAMTTDLIIPLRKLDPKYTPRSASEMRLGDIQDFSTLVPLSQQQGLPLWQLNGGNAALKAKAQSAFRAIALKILNQLK